MPETRPGTQAEAVIGLRPALRPADMGTAEAETGEKPLAEGDADEGLTAADVATLAAISSGGDTPVDPEDMAEAEAAEEVASEAPEVSRGLVLSPLPIARPRVVVRAPPPAQEAPEKIMTASVGTVVRPAPPAPAERPRGLLAAIFRAPDKPSKYPREGSVCGDPAIRGQAVPPIPARIAGCGLANPVRITAVDGVALTTPATVNCEAAAALRSWVTNTAKPALDKAGGGLAALQVAGSYSCRTRNNVPGAKISEHGRGKAVDISGFVLKDGSLVTVLQGWRTKAFGPILKAMHARACGTFGTVLGPRSDGYHQDHFHLDVAMHGYGAYCR